MQDGTAEPPLTLVCSTMSSLRQCLALPYMEMGPVPASKVALVFRREPGPCTYTSVSAELTTSSSNQSQFFRIKQNLSIENI